MKTIKLTAVFAILVFIHSCSKDENKQATKKEEPKEDTSGYAKGADVSWLTEMEDANILFYDSLNNETECLELLKNSGMNAVRLRVWVNPTEGWCNKADVLVKAKRANDLNMRIMIDFHYSDSWADPGKQNKPAAWESKSFDDLCLAVEEHTTEILTALKNLKISPEWVQVGNETGNGMLWDDGKADENMAQYATLTNYGYDAVKAVFPDAKVIVHIQEGNRQNLFKWIFDGLKNNGGKWDVIGMSLYPEAATWKTLNNELIANATYLISRYNTEIMICEVGMNWSEETATYNFLSDLIARTKTNEKILGTFYWEPQCYYGWKGYHKGAFTDAGKPTKALSAFK